MAKTSKRLFGPAALTNAAATKYTAPALTKTLVRHIHAVNGAGSATSLSLSIGADAAATRIFDQYPLAALGSSGATLDHWCYYVVDAAEVVQAFGGTSTDVVLTIDGDELTLG